MLSVIANLNILHGQYFPLFSCNLSTGYEPGASAALSSLYPGASNTTRPYNTQDLSTYLAHSFFPLSLPALIYRVCFLLSWRLYRVYFMCLVAVLPQSTALGGTTPTNFCFVCLLVLPQPTALGGTTPTNFFSCAWWFYPNQLHLVVLPQPIFYFLRLAVLSRPSALGGSTPTRSLIPVPVGSISINCT